MNNTLKEFANYLKYEGIQVDDEDVGKILDMYMRIIIHITQGIQIDTGLNLMLSGKAHIDFSNYTDEIVNTINQYVIDLTDQIADHKLSADTMNSIINGYNIITVLKAAHLFINTILGIETETITHSDHPEIPNDLKVHSFINHNNDGTCLFISAYFITNKDGMREIVYNFVSNCLVNKIPDEIIYV